MVGVGIGMIYNHTIIIYHSIHTHMHICNERLVELYIIGMIVGIINEMVSGDIDNIYDRVIIINDG
jgi:hypothetical protein